MSFKGRLLILATESCDYKKKWREVDCLLDEAESRFRLYHPVRRSLIASFSVTTKTQVWDIPITARGGRHQWHEFYVNCTLDAPLLALNNIEAEIAETGPEGEDVGVARFGSLDEFARVEDGGSSKNSSRNANSRLDVSFHFAALSEQRKQNWIKALCTVVNAAFGFEHLQSIVTAEKPALMALVHQPDLSTTSLPYFYPEKSLKINYNEVDIEPGGLLLPSLAAKEPLLRFQFPLAKDPSDRFCVLMLDLDARTLADRSDAPVFVAHWCRVNMAETEASALTGVNMLDYTPPAPLHSSGRHRYMFVLFRHPPLDLTGTVFADGCEALRTQRHRFPYKAWLQKMGTLMGMVGPVGLSGFYAEWQPRYCDAVHCRKNLKPPKGYRSELQQAAQQSTEDCEAAQRRMAALYGALTLVDLYPSFGAELQRCASCVRGFSASFGAQVLSTEPPTTAALTDIEPSAAQQPPRVSVVLPVCVERMLAPPGESLHPRYYTLILTDVDAPIRTRKTAPNDGRELVHWVVCNAPDGRAPDGDVVLPYFGPAPAFSSGPHRYVLSLYCQAERLDAAGLRGAQTFFGERFGLSSHAWVQACGAVFASPAPAALAAFTSEWEEAVDDYHRALNHVPPARFRSFAQAAAFLQESMERSASRLGKDADGEADVCNVFGGLVRSPSPHSSRHNTPTRCRASPDSPLGSTPSVPADPATERSPTDGTPPRSKAPSFPGFRVRALPYLSPESVVAPHDGGGIAGAASSPFFIEDAASATTATDTDTDTGKNTAKNTATAKIDRKNAPAPPVQPGPANSQGQASTAGGDSPVEDTAAVPQPPAEAEVDPRQEPNDEETARKEERDATGATTQAAEALVLVQAKATATEAQATAQAQEQAAAPLEAGADAERARPRNDKNMVALLQAEELAARVEEARRTAEVEAETASTRAAAETEERSRLVSEAGTTAEVDVEVEADAVAQAGAEAEAEGGAEAKEETVATPTAAEAKHASPAGFRRAGRVDEDSKQRATDGQAQGEKKEEEDEGRASVKQAGEEAAEAARLAGLKKAEVEEAARCAQQQSVARARALFTQETATLSPSAAPVDPGTGAAPSARQEQWAPRAADPPGVRQGAVAREKFQQMEERRLARIATAANSSSSSSSSAPYSSSSSSSPYSSSSSSPSPSSSSPAPAAAAASVAVSLVVAEPVYTVRGPVARAACAEPEISVLGAVSPPRETGETGETERDEVEGTMTAADYDL